jgi:hypothetical protein
LLAFNVLVLCSVYCVTPDELNQKCIARLQNADLESRVAVVGSGPSSPYIARIEKLEQLLCARCGITKSPGEEFWVFSERAHSKNGSEYFRVVKETYGDTPHWTAHVYRHLANMPFRGFATFNYDDQLPTEFQSKYPTTYDKYFSVYPPRNGQTYSVPQEFLTPPPRLIAVHGYCDPLNRQWEKEVILRLEDYNTHYIKHPALLFDWWRDMLLSIPCLFIGTSLREPGLHRVMEYLLSGHYDRVANMGHLHLLDSRPDPITSNYNLPGKSLSVIEQVYFDPIDGHYTGLLKVLAPFSNLPIDRPSPRAPAPKPIMPTDSFDFTSS